MNRTEILQPIAKIGLFVLIAGLVIIAIASQVAQLNFGAWLSLVAQAVGDIPRDMAVLETVALQPSISEMFGLLAFIILISLVIRLYLIHFKPRSLNQSRYWWMFFLLVALFVSGAWLMVAEGGVLSYLFPMAALSILVAVLIDAQLSMLVTFLVALVVGYLAHSSLELTVYAVMGSLLGLLSLGSVKRVNRLLWSGIYVAFANVITILIFHFPDSPLELSGLLELMALGVANGVIAASLALIGVFLVGNLLGIPTSIQLLELAQPTRPLLRQLLLRAPGTYHHSLMVGNLAEQAAEQIGADALLTRVGAYYHDIGKIQSPYFFIENQHETNVHDQLDPQSSARAIISHVEEGLKLAKEYRLPRDVQAFIAEHHGTDLVKYFYHQAREQAIDADRVKEVVFHYPGPKPQRKETAIVMLADSCEAAVRASQPASSHELDRLIHRIIIDKIDGGQLSECDLSLRDLESIHNTFIEILQGVFHPRIVYPQQIDEGVAASNTPPLLPAPSKPEVIPVQSFLGHGSTLDHLPN